MKKSNSYQLLALITMLLIAEINYAQTTFGTNAGTQGSNTNSYYGVHSGANNTEPYNSFFGYQSGRYNNLGDRNSFFGSNSGLNNVDGDRNSFYGFCAGQLNDTGSNNTYTGSQSGQYGISCTNNSFYGTRSGFRNVDGSYNTFIGMYAGEKNSDGNYNSFLGYKSGMFNISGENNSFFGTESGYSNDLGSNNTFLGNKSGRYATGSGNVFLGNSAGFYETGDNKLYIANSNTDTPLIYGDFDNDKLVFNAQIGIASSTGASIIKNEQYNSNGIIEDFLSIKANENNGKPVFISETGRISVGTDDICMKHTTIVDSTYIILEGNAVKTGDAMWYSTSDQNLKKNISPLKSSLNKFLNLNFYSYQYKKTNQTRYGILAQEMEEIFPHSMGKLIEEDGTEYLTFNPNNLFYTGFKATQEIGEMSLAHEAKIERLEKENEQLINSTNQLQKENDQIKDELEAIKTALKNNGIDIAQNDSNDNSLKPEVPRLLQNKPNPFNETTSLPYFLPANIKEAYIIVYDVSGKTIQQINLPIANGYGSIELSLMKTDLSKGTYTYSLFVDGNLIDTRKMLTQ